MTTITYIPESFALSLSGHAGAGTAGRDLVCAGLSTLGWTLLEAARREPAFHAVAEVRPAEAFLSVRCEPEPGAEVRCRAAFETVAAGLRLLEERFPENVKIVEKEEFVLH